MFHIICGPPGSGKSTYVRRVKRSHDLIVDLDYLWTAITGDELREQDDKWLPLMLGLKDLVVQYLIRQKLDVDIWLVTCSPTERGRLMWKQKTGGDVTVLEIGPQSCYQNILRDAGRKDKADLWYPIIEKWWRQYKSSPSDNHINEEKLNQLLEPQEYPRRRV